MCRGIIISNISNLFIVEDLETRNLVKCRARGKLKSEEISPIVGDLVEFQYGENEQNEGIVVCVEARKNVIKRPKLANLTKIVLVVSMKMPKPDLLMLDKQIAFSEFNNIEPIICLNKIDLVDTADVEQIEKIYSDIGYSVIRANAKDRVGVDNLKKLLKGNITAFSGNSGVGKSTLINAIFANKVTEEGNISKKNKRGKNTTTTTYLYKLDDESYIADTPGFSTFDVSEIESKDLYKYFSDLQKYEKNCEFVGCTHIKEENCGIKQALSENKISKSRYENFLKIYQELKSKEQKKW